MERTLDKTLHYRVVGGGQRWVYWHEDGATYHFSIDKLGPSMCPAMCMSWGTLKYHLGKRSKLGGVAKRTA